MDLERVLRKITSLLPFALSTNHSAAWTCSAVALWLELILQIYRLLTHRNQYATLVTKMVTMMRIISRKTLREFAVKHPRSKQPLDDWYDMALRAKWDTPADVKQIARSADILPDNRVVFNISGNHYRLVVKIEYEFRIVYIRFIGTHDDYDRVDATTI